MNFLDREASFDFKYISEWFDKRSVK